ncbi:MAG TPA: isocitrate lyase [Nitrososphaerales archaeon]|nr:isocitrate lyase [Nitrososphaerales archaeon]
MTTTEVIDVEQEWRRKRWDGITRPYTADDVVRLRGSIQIDHTLARNGAEKLWTELQTTSCVSALGCLTGNQAVQAVQAGLRAIYVSGWQVAADANLAGQTYPDQSLYPYDSVPAVVRRINRALQRADQIEHSQGKEWTDWFVPLIADGEAGFGGPLNVFELTKAMIEAGVASVHYEDQLSSEKKCGHLGGKVLVPTSHFIRALVAARLAADIMGAPTLILARTDAEAATLITSDVDALDKEFMTGERTSEGFYKVKNGLEAAIARSLAYAPYADMLWFETAKPDLEEAREFSEALHKKYPGKILAYNCSPSFNWEKNLGAEQIASFREELASMGYRFQFITLAGFHALNHSMFSLAKGYAAEGMTAYVKLQREEFMSEQEGYAGVKHQAFVGTGYFDDVASVVSAHSASTLAMKGSTEEKQFETETVKNRDKP